MLPEIVELPVPMPELVIEPMLLMLALERTTPPAMPVWLFNVRLPLPEMAPEIPNDVPAVPPVVYSRESPPAPTVTLFEKETEPVPPRREIVIGFGVPDEFTVPLKTRVLPEPLSVMRLLLSVMFPAIVVLA